MGSKPAPPYANIFLARKIDKQIWDIAMKLSQNSNDKLLFLKRFLDDLFLIYTGETKNLHYFLEEVNKIHPNMTFTMEHTTPQSESEKSQCKCRPRQSVPFLDTSCSIKEGKVIFDLYRKPTDRNKYLLPDSCHPDTCKENIPFSLAMRINRICSEPETRDMRFSELKEMLLQRKYRSGMIDSAISRARSIPRLEALKYVVKTKTTRRPVCVVSWDPRLPSLPAIKKKHWRAMTTTDPYLKEVFPEPPLTAYKRQKNIRDYLIRAKIPPLQADRPRRDFSGMKKCGKQCLACPYIQEGKKVFSVNNKFSWSINKEVTCNTYNIVYLIQCNKENCRKQYIGESERVLKNRLAEHIGYVKSKNINQPTGEHFNLPGHTLSNMNILILEKVKNFNTNYRKEREKYLIRKLNTYYME